MNRKNIDGLGARLRMLGFGEGINERLAAYCCFDPVEFSVTHCIEEPGVFCFFEAYCRKGDLGFYDAVYFTATLRKQPEVNEKLRQLDSDMSAIDWLAIHEAREKVSSVIDFITQTEKAAALLTQMATMDETGFMRFKHWAGTVLESMIPNLSHLRSQFEISQKFYLLPDQPPISFAEALRFLLSRWMERKIVADRRLLVKNKDKAGGAGGKLLAKRVRAGRRTGNDKQH